MRVSVVNMNGLELAAFDADHAWIKGDVIKALRKAGVSYRCASVRIFFNTSELLGVLTLGDIVPSFAEEARACKNCGSSSTSESSSKKARTQIELAMVLEACTVATSSYPDGTVKLWAASSGECVHTITARQICGKNVAVDDRTVESMIFSPNNKALLIQTVGGFLSQFSLESGKRMHAWWPRLRVQSVEYSPSGQWILIVTEDCKAKQYSASSGKELFTLERYNATAEAVSSAVYSPSGEEIWTISRENGPKHWSSSTGEWLFSMSNDGLDCTWKGVPSLFSPDGGRVLSLLNTITAELRSFYTGRCICTLESIGGQAVDAKFSSDGQLILVFVRSPSLRIWSAVSGKVLQTIEHFAAVHSFGHIVFSEAAVSASMYFAWVPLRFLFGSCEHALGYYRARQLLT